MATPDPEPTARTRPPGGGAGRWARASWVLFDWAAQPYFTLITTFLFAPYFASHFIGDPVRGQALWGYAQGLGGAIIALAAPVIGAIADQTGRRKPWIGLFSLALVAGAVSLWFAVPGTGLPVAAVFAAIVLSLIGAEFATAFTNAMLPELAPPEAIGRLSGLGWATGYAGGIVALLLVLVWFAATSGQTTTMAGLTPLFDLPGPFPAERLTGPFTALWYVIFVIPLFLFVPERAGPPVVRLGRAVPAGLRALKTTLRSVGRWRNVARFLIARMIYIDGLAALFVFAGIFAAGQFGWSSVEHGLFGILITVVAALGAVAGGRLDDRIGSKRVCQLSIIGLVAAIAGIGSLDRDTVAFVIDVGPHTGSAALFAGTSEKVFLMFSSVIGICAGPLQASSLSLMARISPPRQSTAFFGLYALSGKATAFAGPVSIALLTQWSGSQKTGLAVVLVFLGVGFWLLRGVREQPD